MEGGISYRPHGSVFKITATAEDAPESCGTFYWDPLLEAVPGDGFAWELASDANDDGGAGDDMAAIIGAVIGVVVFIAIVVVVVSCFKKKSAVEANALQPAKAGDIEGALEARDQPDTSKGA